MLCHQSIGLEALVYIPKEKLLLKLIVSYFGKTIEKIDALGSPVMVCVLWKGESLACMLIIWWWWYLSCSIPILNCVSASQWKKRKAYGICNFRVIIKQIETGTQNEEQANLNKRLQMEEGRRLRPRMCILEGSLR